MTPISLLSRASITVFLCACWVVGIGLSFPNDVHAQALSFSGSGTTTLIVSVPPYDCYIANQMPTTNGEGYIAYPGDCSVGMYDYPTPLLGIVGSGNGNLYGQYGTYYIWAYDLADCSMVEPLVCPRQARLASFTYTPDEQVTVGDFFIPTTNNTAYVDIVLPVFNTYTTSSTTVEIDFINPSFGVAPVTLHYEITDAVTGSLLVSSDSFIGTSTADGTLTDERFLTDGSKYINAWIKSPSGAQIGQIAEVFFHVNTNSYLATYGIDNPYADASGFSQIDCELFDIGCQFQKAMAFLFKPSNNALNRFSSIWVTISTKPPFGYVSTTITQLNTLTSTSSAAFSFGTIPFVDSIFLPFRALLASILWVIFFISWYHFRLKHLDI